MLWRVRTALPDRPGALAVLAENGGAAGVNLLGLQIFPGVDAVTDELVLRTPADWRIPEIERLVGAHLQNAQSAIARGIKQTDVYSLLMSMARGEERADPSAIPPSTTVRIEMRPEDRGRAVVAACLRRDGLRAAKLADPLTGEIKRRAARVCAGEGIDLPQ